MTAGDIVDLESGPDATGRNGFLTFRIGGAEYGVDPSNCRRGGATRRRPTWPTSRLASRLCNLRRVIVPIVDVRIQSDLPKPGGTKGMEHSLGIGTISEGMRERKLIPMDFERLTRRDRTEIDASVAA